jgi:hypothetical protein
MNIVVYYPDLQKYRINLVNYTSETEYALSDFQILIGPWW